MIVTIDVVRDEKTPKENNINNKNQVLHKAKNKQQTQSGYLWSPVDESCRFYCKICVELLKASSDWLVSAFTSAGCNVGGCDAEVRCAPS